LHFSFLILIQLLPLFPKYYSNLNFLLNFILRYYYFIIILLLNFNFINYYYLWYLFIIEAKDLIIFIQLIIKNFKDFNLFIQVAIFKHFSYLYWSTVFIRLIILKNFNLIFPAAKSLDWGPLQNLCSFSLFKVNF
jgi:hypothetical protein